MILFDLEKKIESICKGASSYYSSLFKKYLLKIPEMQKFCMSF